MRDSIPGNPIAGLPWGNDRCSGWFPSGAVTRPQLEWIADEVAGLARYGIQSLRAAAERARDRGAGTLDDEDVAAAFDQAQHYIRQQNVRPLAFHHHVLYTLIHEAGEIDAHTLHERYDTIAGQAYEQTTLTPIVKRTRRDQLRKLQAYGLITAAGSGTTRSYRVVDDAVEPPITLPMRA